LKVVVLIKTVKTDTLTNIIKTAQNALHHRAMHFMLVLSGQNPKLEL